MSQREPVDVTFEEVKAKRTASWMPAAGDWEQIGNTVVGLMLLGMACYGVHLLLANNF